MRSRSRRPCGLALQGRAGMTSGFQVINHPQPLGARGPGGPFEMLPRGALGHFQSRLPVPLAQFLSDVKGIEHG